jgi:hypothetical protein
VPQAQASTACVGPPLEARPRCTTPIPRPSARASNHLSYPLVPRRFGGSRGAKCLLLGSSRPEARQHALISNEKKEPDDAALRQLAEELADTEERVQVIAIALDRTTDAVLDLIAEKKEEWLADQQKVIEEARKTLRNAVEAWAQARADLGSEVGFANWIATFERKPMAGPKSAPKPFKVGDGPDDRALGHEELVKLLLADVEPPAPPVPRVMFAPQTWPAMGVSVGRADG